MLVNDFKTSLLTLQKVAPFWWLPRTPRRIPHSISSHPTLAVRRRMWSDAEYEAVLTPKRPQDGLLQQELAAVVDATRYFIEGYVAAVRFPVDLSRFQDLKAKRGCPGPLGLVK